jgi:hypothetical protein
MQKSLGSLHALVISQLGNYPRGGVVSSSLSNHFNAFQLTLLISPNLIPVDAATLR